jgi:hypothetical protein
MRTASALFYPHFPIVWSESDRMRLPPLAKSSPAASLASAVKGRVHMFYRLIFLLVSTIGLALPSAAEAQWKRATSDNFVVYSNGKEESLRAFTAKIEAFDSLLRIMTNVQAPPVPKRLEVYLLRDANSVARLLGKGGRNVAGFYTPRLSGAIAVVPRIGSGSKYDLDGETVLFHEYAHHFMMQYFPSAYPAWYVEGFAEFYSTAEIGEDGTASIGKAAYHRAYGLIQAAPFPLARLLSARPDAKTAEEMDSYYGRSWLLTHMLTFSDSRKSQLSRYLIAFATGMPAEKAATEAFGPLPALDKDLNAYLDSRMSYKKLSGLDAKAAKIVVDKLDPALDALFIDRLNLLTDIDEAEKPRFLTSVRKEAARFPDNPHALDMLVEAYLLEDKTDEAAALNDRLIALKPDFAPALLRKAEAMADNAKDVEDQKSHWKAIRALIIQANRINNDDTVALLRYYQSFLRQGIEPTKAAVDGLIRTYDLAPQLPEVRMALAQQLIRDKRTKEARAVLIPVAYAPHAAENGTAARAMIAAIDKGKAPEPEGKVDVPTDE